MFGIGVWELVLVMTLVAAVLVLIGIVVLLAASRQRHDR